jgi:hypothetical protein
MNNRGSFRKDYGWAEAERDLADGVHPAVVGARLGESEVFVLEVANERGWPITWDGTPKKAKWIDAVELDS